MDQNVPRHLRRALDVLSPQPVRPARKAAALSTTEAVVARHRAPWFAVATRAGQELRVRRQFAAQEMTHLLPLWRPRRAWLDCLKGRLEPLFQGFIFVSCDPESLQRVRHIQGVRKIIGDDDLPLPIASEAIGALQLMVAHRLPYRPHLPQYAGWKARVLHGALAGAQGRFCIQDRPAHIVINFELIQRAVAVEVPPEGSRGDPVDHTTGARGGAGSALARNLLKFPVNILDRMSSICCDGAASVV